MVNYLLTMCQTEQYMPKQAQPNENQETRMLSQALNRAMPHSRNQLEAAVNRKKLIFYLAVQLYCTLKR